MPAANSSDASTYDLTVDLGGGLVLPSPLIAASGTVGFGDTLGDLTRFEGLGALITPSITLEPRAGNSMPRTAEASAGLIHATGLPNPGLAGVRRDHVPAFGALPCGVIASVAARAPAEWSLLAGSLAEAGGIRGIELNLAWLDPALFEDPAAQPLSERELEQALQAAVQAARTATSLPLLAKLPAVGIDPGRAARIVVDAGADVVCAAQALPAVAVRLSSRAFRLPGVAGALSGPCIKPIALYHTWRIAHSVRQPVVGGGGIMTAEDALEFMVAGACAVSIGVANYVHPMAIATIASEMRNFLSQSGFSTLAAFQASLQPPE